MTFLKLPNTKFSTHISTVM